MFLRLCLIAAVALPVAACAVENEGDRQSRIRAPAIEVAGEPVSCIQTNLIRNTVVHDDYTIDFEMAGDRVYRNTLPNRCYSLGFEERFAHSSSTGQLCSVDTITVLYSNGSRGAGCGLGEFLPVRYVAKAD